MITAVSNPDKASSNITAQTSSLLSILPMNPGLTISKNLKIKKVDTDHKNKFPIKSPMHNTNILNSLVHKKKKHPAQNPTEAQIAHKITHAQTEQFTFTCAQEKMCSPKKQQRS